MKHQKLILILITTTLLSSCSSPEADGKKAAQKACNCIDEYAKNVNKAYTAFADKFDSYSFQTRIEAREKIDAEIQKLENELEKCKGNAFSYYDKLEGKYKTNREKSVKFQYAYLAKMQDFDANTKIDIAALQNRVDNRILTIIPPKPDLEKLKKDLIGRKIAEGVDGYRKKDWYWEIKSLNQLKNVEIKKIENKGDDYRLDVHLVLQGENTDYEADVRIFYVLRQYDDWTIDVIETQNMQIVQTGKYANCITTERGETLIGAIYYEFTNSCDVPLLIGGVIFMDYEQRWEKFSLIVNANSSETTRSASVWRIRECKIHFIERP